MSVVDSKETVKEIFINYLKVHQHRKTPERFSVLDEIYSVDGHFDVESLYIQMRKKRYRVSRATIYNTIELLIDCNLVTKHQFGKNLAQFEKSHEFRQHDHLICEDCQKVFEFCDPRIHQIEKTASAFLGFEVTNHSLNIYGKCNRLAKEGACEHKNKIK